ncbi:MAG: Uma2 family endonuclease [Actinophytocola sp.]|uniref:Uma2 family endonuclease n=1 Tax=Actinophytocola sp. TaxID=1872138 RepID=UPI00132C324A|nr:Uma2 family endonuclease [Actinophytocola sp.]MPZ81215.1 Uma2 family endonuclease [Actinophytocola sp.]
MTAEAGSVRLAHGRPFTVDDLEAMPDDGNRYELLDGMLIVSPAPGRRHQKVAYRLYNVLEQACPDEFDVLGAPFSVRPSRTTELQPDVLVGRDEDFTDKLLPVAPVLAVEIFSPSSVLNDLNNKKAAYQRLGVLSYWAIDPEDPTLTVFELDDAGVYQQVAEVKGADAFEATRPFPVRVVPVELLGKLAGK